MLLLNFVKACLFLVISLQIHSAKTGTCITVGKSNGVQRDLVGRVQSDDGRVRKLCHTEIFRVWNARTEAVTGTAYTWPCHAIVAADVRMSYCPEGLGEHSI